MIGYAPACLCRDATSLLDRAVGGVRAQDKFMLGYDLAPLRGMGSFAGQTVDQKGFSYALPIKANALFFFF